jgi:hypothetical protein
VGGLEVQETARKLEQTAAAGDLSSAAETLLELEKSFERAMPVMERFCHETLDQT